MSKHTAKRIEDIEAVRGAFRRVRDEIGVSSFGINVIDYPPNAEWSPDHAEPDQEEVYVTLSGAGEIDVQGERIPLDPGVLIRIAPGTRHKMLPGPEGMRVLALGGIPGAPTSPPTSASSRSTARGRRSRTSPSAASTRWSRPSEEAC